MKIFIFQIAIALINFLRYRQGIANVFGSYEDPNQPSYNQNSNPASNDSYRQAPFNTNSNYSNVNAASYQQQPTY